jgi:hypothetical protein
MQTISWAPDDIHGRRIARAGKEPLLTRDTNRRLTCMQVRLEQFSAIWSGLEQPGGRSEPL